MIYIITISKHNNVDFDASDNTCLCFEQEVASVKTLVMYKGLLENAMQMKN